MSEAAAEDMGTVAYGAIETSNGRFHPSISLSFLGQSVTFIADIGFAPEDKEQMQAFVTSVYKILSGPQSNFEDLVGGVTETRGNYDA